MSNKLTIENAKPGTFLSELGGFKALDLVRASATGLNWPVKQSASRSMVPAQPLTQVMPSYGSNTILARPVNEPVQASDLVERSIFSDPRDLWYLSLPSKMTPTQVLQILRSALGGDLWQQWQLTKLMSDSWPMFSKCSNEIRSAVANVKYKVEPYCVKGKQPTARAKAKADVVSLGFTSWKIDQFSDEKEMTGLVYHATDSLLNGCSLLEIIWQDNVGGQWTLPRAATWVHPRFYSFGNAGRIIVYDQNYRAMVSPDPNKYFTMQYMSDSGSVLGSGLARRLAWDWSAVMFNREWMLKYAQKHGGGFLKMKAPDGATEDDIKKLNAFAAQAVNQGWIVLRQGEDAEHTPPGTMGAENPQRVLKQEADDDCQLLFLGQLSTTATSSSGTKGMNSTGNNQFEVREEKKEELAKAVATGPLTQIAAAICRVNFGDDDECPVISPDMVRPLNAQEKAEVIGALNASKVPIKRDEYYELTGTTMPNEGDEVVIPSTGEAGELGPTDEPLAVAQTPEPPPVKLDENNNPLPPLPAVQPPKQIGNVRASEAQIKHLLTFADDEQVGRIQKLIVKASEATHQNGEIHELELEFEKLEAASRVK